MNYALSYLSILLVVVSSPCYAQSVSLQMKIEKVIQTAKGKVGVSIQFSGDDHTIGINGNEHFPMQSIYKFHLALAVLYEVDHGSLALDKKIHIKKEDLLPGTVSPLREKYPEGNIDITLGELIQYTVAQSDNNGCDILFRLIGGTKKADQLIHSLGTKDMAITATEEEMHKAWDIQFTNWSTPKSMTELLAKALKGNTLSPSSKDFLWKTMVATVNGPKRIKGLLPEGTVVTHKPGTSGTNDQGVMAAVNDAGIVMLPNGKYFIISVFITNSTGSLKENEEVIAKVTKEAWDYYVGY